MAIQQAIQSSNLSHTARNIVAAAPSFSYLLFDSPDADVKALPASGCAATPDVLPDNITRETGGQFTLGQNYPNPYVSQTIIPFTLTRPADVQLGIFDTQGRKVAGVVRKKLAAGDQRISLNLYGLGLPAGDYSYQLQVSNSRGVYHQRKQMTIA